MEDIYNEVALSRFEKVPGVGGHRHKVKAKKDSVFDADLDKYKVSVLYCISEMSGPILRSNLVYEIGQDF